MVAAIDYQKLAPHPKVPLPSRARTNQGNDFQPSKSLRHVIANFASTRAGRRCKVILVYGGRFWFPILLPRGQATLESIARMRKWFSNLKTRISDEVRDRDYA